MTVIRAGGRDGALGIQFPCQRWASKMLSKAPTSNTTHPLRGPQFWFQPQEPGGQDRTEIISHHFRDGEIKAKIITVME